jgi:hypothetical protein
MFNSTISTPGARLMVLNIKDFCLNNKMQCCKCTCILLATVTQAIIDQHNLISIANKGHVCVEITKDMCSLPQARCIANDALVLHLAQHGCHPSAKIPGLFKHETRPISFCPAVDNFGIKCVGKERANHLIQTLQS